MILNEPALLSVESLLELLDHPTPNSMADLLCDPNERNVDLARGGQRLQIAEAGIHADALCYADDADGFLIDANFSPETRISVHIAFDRDQTDLAVQVLDPQTHRLRPTPLHQVDSGIMIELETQAIIGLTRNGGPNIAEYTLQVRAEFVGD